MRILKVVLVLSFLLLNIAALKAETPMLLEAMARHLVCYPLETVSMQEQKLSLKRRDLCLAAIYNETGGAPLWVGEHGPGIRAAVILHYLRNADKEGLEPQHYQVSEIEKIWMERTPESLVELDALLTFNAVKYMHNVRNGDLGPYMVNPDLFSEAGQKPFEPVAIVEEMLAAQDLDQFFTEAPPQNKHYTGLKRALAKYRTITLQEQWQVIAAGRSIRPDETDRRIPQIRQRLALLLRLDPENPESEEYDASLQERLRLFQELHGLDTDGIIGSRTLAELNVSPAERLGQIQVNMARWRWQEHDFGGDYIIVNIADFHLYGYRDGLLSIDLPVIVGKSQHQTPVFSDRIKYIEFNPFWNIPTSIAVKEELPKLRENPYHLVDKNIRLFSSWQEEAVELDSTAMDWSSISRSQMARYKLRQDPGPKNALGRMKFVFPNKYSVYLHDTPARTLFSEQHRFFSHGCIRVYTPEKLAHFILRDNADGWNQDKISETIEKGKRKIVLVRPPLDIHLTYQTAWLDKEGRIHFNRDIYERDKMLYKALSLR